MVIRQWRLGIVAVLGGVALLAAACGGAAAPAPTSAPSKPAAAPTTAPAAAAPTTAPAAAAPTKAPEPAKPAEVIQMKLSHHEPAGGRIGQGYQKWADMVGEKTNGRVKITVYAGETLGKGRDAYPMVQNGIADIAWVVGAFFPGQFPLTEVYNLPLLGVPSGKVGGASLWDVYQQNPEMQKEWSQVKTLCVYSSGVQFVATAKKPVKQLEDLKGLKLRVAGWGPTAFLKAVGGNPIAITPPEMYDAIQKGVLDGMIFDWQGIQSSRLYEVLNHATPFTVVNVPQGFIMNNKTWEKLPPDIQKVFTDMGGKWGAEFFGSAFDQADPEGADNFKKLGKEIITLSPEEQKRWQDSAKPIWNEWVSQMKGKGQDGQKALDQILAALEKNKKQ